MLLISSFLDCTPGYMGEGCKQKCRYPNYGIGCQSGCSCIESSCDHILGCNISESKRKINVLDLVMWYIPLKSLP